MRPIPREDKMSKWQFLTGDVNYKDYGGKWYRQVKGEIYHIVELVNIEEATGKSVTDKYFVNLQEIDLDLISQKDLKSAIESCELQEDIEITPIITIDILSAYGRYTPMGNWEGNNYREVIKQAKAESNRLSTDSDYRERQLDRPVNRIGSTAREFGAGDYDSAIIRGIAKGDKVARLLGKIQGRSQEDMDSIGKEYEDFTLTPTE